MSFSDSGGNFGKVRAAVSQKNHLKRGQGIQYINSNYYKKLHKKFHQLETLESNEIEKYLITKIRNTINDKNYT